MLATPAHADEGSAQPSGGSSDSALQAVPPATAEAGAGELVAGTPSDAQPEEAQESAQDPSGEAKPAVAKEKLAKPKLSYKAKYGKSWKSGWTKQGKTAGKKGADLFQFKAKVARDGLSGSVKYRSYEKGKGGWTKWASDGKAVGIAGWRMRGLQMKLSGKLAKQFDIVYRVYLHGDGWQPWVVNGATAGSTGKLGQIERFQAKLVRKGEGYKVPTGTYILTKAKASGSALVLPGESLAQNKQLGQGAYDASSQAERFYLRNESDGTITLQSVLSGKFLCDRSGKAVQRSWKQSDQRFRWKLSWNGGWRMTNASTGKSLALSGAKAKSASSGTRFSLNPTNLFAAGTYSLSNEARGAILAVKGSSKAEGAKLIVQSEQESGAEAFSFVSAGGERYQLVNALSGMAVAVKGASKANGAAVCQYAAKKGDKAQRWKAKLDRAGTFTFVNQATGKVLGAASKGKPGAAAKSQKASGASAQAWTVYAVDYSLTGDAGLDASIAKILESHTTLRSCFNYVVGFPYRSGSKYGKQTLGDSTTVSMAKEMVRNHGGNCYRFASLFSWLARGLGYSTSVRAGYVPSASGGLAPHGWVEVYENGRTYVCDPDLAHEMPGHAWYMTTYASAPVYYTR